MMKPQGDRVVDVGARSITDAHHFAHEAMATVFELYIVEEDETYARQGHRRHLRRWIDSSWR